jgi:hypothetical protein
VSAKPILIDAYMELYYPEAPYIGYYHNPLWEIRELFFVRADEQCLLIAIYRSKISKKHLYIDYDVCIPIALHKV